ncbi:hypothetical protein ACLOJK_000437 [Asimina triloba]
MAILDHPKLEKLLLKKMVEIDYNHKKVKQTWQEIDVVHWKGNASGMKDGDIQRRETRYKCIPKSEGSTKLEGCSLAGVEIQVFFCSNMKDWDGKART